MNISKKNILRKEKIFGIGLSRTGTTSLAAALKLLGFEAVHYPPYYIDKFFRIQIEKDILNNNEALTDAPIAHRYKELDSQFPGSKFILTYRSDEEWIKSAKKFFTRPKGKFNEVYIRDILKCVNPQNKIWRNRFIVRIIIYGSYKFKEQSYLKNYQKHNSEVIDYFKDRKNDLLVIDLTKDEFKWEKICEFLGVAVPDVSFPHSNNSKLKQKGVK